MPWRTIFVGGLGLIALQVAVTNPDAAGRLREGMATIADLIRSAADPSIPAIPDLRSTSSDDGSDGDSWVPDWLEDPPFPFGPPDPYPGDLPYVPGI